jgi:hypothetical protein
MMNNGGKGCMMPIDHKKKNEKSRTRAEIKLATSTNRQMTNGDEDRKKLTHCSEYERPEA